MLTKLIQENWAEDTVVDSVDCTICANPLKPGDKFYYFTTSNQGSVVGKYCNDCITNIVKINGVDPFTRKPVSSCDIKSGQISDSFEQPRLVADPMADRTLTCPVKRNLTPTIDRHINHTARCLSQGTN